MTFSVRFFKRLILLVLLLMIVVPTCCAFFFWQKTGNLERQLAEHGEDPSRPGQVSPAPSGDPGVVPTSYDTALEGEPLNYQTLFPDLYGTASVTGQRTKAIDTVYLTFDCTPSSNTLEILDKLDVYGIKATFFVNGSTDLDAQDVLKQIVDRGHTIGLRGNSTSYQKIYQSVEAYLEDFNEIYNLVYETTGVRAEIFRFPGGALTHTTVEFTRSLSLKCFAAILCFLIGVSRAIPPGWGSPLPRRLARMWSTVWPGRTGPL